MEHVATYQINVYAASYLVNGDSSGLEQDEIDAIDSLVGEGYLVLSDEEPEWRACEATGLWSDCHIYHQYA